MADEQDFTFRPPADEGQPGYVTTADGRRAFRYEGKDELIYDESATAPGPSAAE